jgi:hypothetical protein
MSHDKSKGSSQLMSHIEPEGLSQQRRPVLEVLATPYFSKKNSIL